MPMLLPVVILTTCCCDAMHGRIVDAWAMICVLLSVVDAVLLIDQDMYSMYIYRYIGVIRGTALLPQ